MATRVMKSEWGHLWDSDYCLLPVNLVGCSRGGICWDVVHSVWLKGEETSCPKGLTRFNHSTSLAGKVSMGQNYISCDIIMICCFH